MKRMPKPMPSTESPATSPEMGRRRYNYYNSSTNTPHSHQHSIHNSHMLNNNINNNNTFGRPPSGQSSRFSGSRFVHMPNSELYPESFNYSIHSYIFPIYLPTDHLMKLAGDISNREDCIWNWSVNVVAMRVHHLPIMSCSIIIVMQQHQAQVMVIQIKINRNTAPVRTIVIHIIIR